MINELLDAPSDLHHPVKRHRPVPSGLVNIPLAYVQWIALMVVGRRRSALLVDVQFALTLLVLWVMGCVYNLPPVRTKDHAVRRRRCRRRSTTRSACSPAGSS